MGPETRIDHILGGVYRISTLAPAAGITFNQFLIDDERPMLVHTGVYAAWDDVRRAIREVLDPARLAYVSLLHWEGDEAGGLDRILAESPNAEVVASDLSVRGHAARSPARRPGRRSRLSRRRAGFRLGSAGRGPFRTVRCRA